MNKLKELLGKFFGRRDTGLEIFTKIAQISLAVVAIFGYFYTVQPIYQKERLAEQVAKYEGIIEQQKPKIAEAEARIAELQRERERLSEDATHEREKITQDAQRERTRLSGELKTLEGQLAAVREAKNKIERQTEFMAYRYRLPDGSPAVTREQVKLAQVSELRKSFLSSLSIDCGSGLRTGAFLTYSYSRPEATDKAWPFTEKELEAWKASGADYPLVRALECIESEVADYSKRYGASFPTEIDGLHKEAVEFAKREGAKPWTPPVQPDNVLQELASGRAEIQTNKTAALKKVEEEYGAWESVTLPDRKEIYKNNYFVRKRNADMEEMSKQLSVQGKAQAKANTLRKGLQDEVKRLIIKEESVATK